MVRLTSAALEDFKKELLTDDMMREALLIPKEHYGNWISLYNAHIVTEQKLEKDYTDYRRHFRNWFKMQDATKPPPSPTQIEKQLVANKPKPIADILKKYTR